MGLVAVAERIESDAPTIRMTEFEIERSEQISRQMVEHVIIDNEKRCTNYNVICTRFINEGNLPQHTLPYNADIVLVDQKTGNSGKVMLAKDMVQYERTPDMLQLYLMLNNDATAYRLWHDYAVTYAKQMLKGEAVLMDPLADKMKKLISQSCDRLMKEYHKITGSFLDITEEQKMVVSWQWFYDDMMETYNFIKLN